MSFFNELFDKYLKEKEHRLKRELSYREICRETYISFQKLSEWHSSTQPDCTRSDKKNNTYADIKSLADFFDLTPTQENEFLDAAGCSKLRRKPPNLERKKRVRVEIEGSMTEKEIQKIIKKLRCTSHKIKVLDMRNIP